MIKNVFFEGRNLTIVHEIGTQKRINIGATIYKAIFTSKHIVLLLSWEELNGTEFHNRNIICLDEQGKEVWRIENPDLVSLSKERTPNAFTNITLKDADKIEAFTFDCYTVDIDINTGKFISEWEFTK